MKAPGWPARLEAGALVVRPLERRDAVAWREVRMRNHAWLAQWEATAPPGAKGPRPDTFSGVVRRLRSLGRLGMGMPFVIEVEGHFAGQVTVNNIVRGAAQFASIGYWIDGDLAGRGIVPQAVAMVIDHCFGEGGLHRVEICVRPENTNSLRVVEKLGLHEVGFAPRFLHIDGQWRDHRIYAITREECPEGMVTRLMVGSRAPESHESHE